MIRRGIGWIALAGVLVLGAGAPKAQAEGWQWTRGNYNPRHAMRRHHGGVAGELATYAGDEGGTQVLLQSPLFGFWYAVANHFTLSLDWGLSYYRENTNGNKERRFRFGDPMVSGYYVGHAHDMVFYAGVGLALPAATVPAHPDPNAPGIETRDYQHALAARGGWNSFLWIPEACSLVFPMRIESSALKHLLLAADASLGIPIFLQGQGAALVLQAGGEVGFKAPHGAFGGRFQFFWWALEDTPFLNQMAQMSIEPFFRIDFGKPFLEARLTINLDHPYGFSFDNGGVWGLHLGAGTEF